MNISSLGLKKYTKIISFSDVHGDIDALIIALRDCAKVIKKSDRLYKPNPDYKYTDIDSEINIRKNNNDDFLDYLLNLDLNIPDQEDYFNRYMNDIIIDN